MLGCCQPGVNLEYCYDDVLNNTGVGFDDPASGAAQTVGPALPQGGG